jgi:hypothetical protein
VYLQARCLSHQKGTDRGAAAEMYLTPKQTAQFSRLLKTFFTLTYSTDLDGKDAEKLMRIVKGCTGALSRRKELFDIVDGRVAYSVKTLRKSPNATRVDLQEQRFCDVKEMQEMISTNKGDTIKQGRLLLRYMRNRIIAEMERRKVTVAKSAILLKWWDSARTNFSFRYWEEDFLGYLDELWKRNDRGEIGWVMQPAGIHARDLLRTDAKGKHIRLLRMHHKHNQIFTDHDIPMDAIKIEFTTKQLSLQELAKLLKI